MRRFLAALALTAIAGCEEPRFEGEIDAYAPACNNRPYVTAGFDGFTIRCGGYFYQYTELEGRCAAELQKAAEPCITIWRDYGCAGDVIGYWAVSCMEFDEEGNEISRSSSYNVPATEEQAQEYVNALESIGHDAAREKWIEWNNE